MELLHRVFFTAMGAASIFYLFVKIRLSHWKYRGILHEKPKFLWGNLKDVGKKRHISDALEEVYEKFKTTDAPFVGFYAFIKPMAMILKLDLVKNILDKDFEYFSERGLYNNVSDDPLSENLVQLDGENWQHLRTKLTPVFCCTKLNLIIPKLLSVATTFERTLIQQYRNQQIFNINDIADCYNVDIVSSLAFGLEGNTLKWPTTGFRSMTKNFYPKRSLFKEFLSYSYPNLARHLHYRSFDKDVSQAYFALMNDKIMERGWLRRPEHKDFLDLFMEVQRARNSGRCLNDKQLAVQSFSFVLAGLEASNLTIAYCLYELAMQPELQQKLHTEIVNVLQKHNGVISASAMAEMRYLDQVLFETLRRYPPYSFVMRTTTKDYEIPDSVFMLKKGTPIIIPVAAIHNDPLIYQNPWTFDPSRFTPEASRQRHPMSWIPFGYGPRGCIAVHLFKIQISVCLIMLLRSFRFSPCEQTTIPISFDKNRFLLGPQADIKLLLERI